MEATLNSTEIPSGYPFCLNEQCPKAASCLRQLATKYAPEDREYWVIINPKRQATSKETCPYYRTADKVRYAKGFIGILDSLPHKQTRIAIPILFGKFSERTYYRIRKGERLLSPADQKQILAIFRKCGATGPLEFDKYVEGYQW